MTEIREYNPATGHVEVLDVVADDRAEAVAVMLNDHATDHVIYTKRSDEN